MTRTLYWEDRNEMGRKKEKTDEEILVAARSCFIQYGPAVATGVIAKELGVSQATLFNRFNTKRELMFAALGPPDDSRINDILSRAPDDRTIRQQLIDIGTAAVDYFNETDPRLAVLKAAGLTPEQLHECYSESPADATRQKFTRWLSDAQNNDRVTDVDAEYVSVAFLGALKSGISALEDHPANDQIKYIEGVVDIFWQAMDPAPQSHDH